jgi:hypothetical protein
MLDIGMPEHLGSRHPLKNPVSDPYPMEVIENDDNVPMNDDGLPREEIVEECKSLDAKPQKKKTSVETLTNSELNQIQEYLHTINQPTWHCGPPTNLGDAEHGKLKAEQWQSSIEFDLPVILCRLWGSRNIHVEDDGTSS